MAPELLRRGADLDSRADVYSLGMVLQEMAVQATPQPLADLPDQTVLPIMMSQGPVAVPPTPEWCGLAWQVLVSACTADAADQRPSLENIQALCQQELSRVLQEQALEQEPLPDHLLGSLADFL